MSASPPTAAQGPLARVKEVIRGSIDGGLRNPPVRWLMLAAPFTMGVGIFAFYALQPYLLQLYGDERAFAIAGLAAAIVAGAQMLGGLIAPRVRRWFRRRTHALLLAAATGAVCLALLGWTTNLWLALALSRRHGAGGLRQPAPSAGLPERGHPVRDSARPSCPSTT